MHYRNNRIEKLIIHYHCQGHLQLHRTSLFLSLSYFCHTCILCFHHSIQTFVKSFLGSLRRRTSWLRSWRRSVVSGTSFCTPLIFASSNAWLYYALEGRLYLEPYKTFLIHKSLYVYCPIVFESVFHSRRLPRIRLGDDSFW